MKEKRRNVRDLIKMAIRRVSERMSERGMCSSKRPFIEINLSEMKRETQEKSRKEVCNKKGCGVGEGKKDGH